MQRNEIEHLLDAHTLQVCFVMLMHKPRWYNVRRNGKTKTWKRTPERYVIPVKIGSSEAFRINNNHHGLYLRERPADFNERIRQ